MKNELIIILEQIKKELLKLEEEGLEIIAIELASYLPIRTNPELDNNELNVVFIEKPKTHIKKMS